MAKVKKSAEEPPKAPTPDPIPIVPEPPSPFPEVDNTPEPPANFYPEVIVRNNPNAVMATEAEKAEGIMPKNTNDAPKASDYPDVQADEN